MSQTGYKGIAFPFRFNSYGGTSVSSTNANDFSHIDESIYQIVMTSVGERRHLPKFGSEANLATFTSDEVDMKTLEYYVQEAVENNEPRVKVDDVSVTSDEINGIGCFKVYIEYTVIKYMKSQQSVIYIDKEGLKNELS